MLDTAHPPTVIVPSTTCTPTAPSATTHPASVAVDSTTLKTPAYVGRDNPANWQFFVLASPPA